MKTYTFRANVAAIMSELVEDSRVVPVASKFPRRVREEVERLAKEREWSLSKTILHLTERGLAQVNNDRQSANAA